MPANQDTQESGSCSIPSVPGALDVVRDASQSEFLELKFLSQLRNSASPEEASRALALYFSKSNQETITQKIVASSPAACNSPPLLSWLEHWKSPEITTALINQAKALGADFEIEFRHSVYDPVTAKSKSEKHTVLSVLVSHAQFGDDGKIDGRVADQVLCLMGQGKRFDKCTATRLVRMRKAQGIAWIEFFIDNKLINSDEILGFTDRLAVFNPEIKAQLSSMSAMRAIDEMLSSMVPGGLSP